MRKIYRFLLKLNFVQYLLVFILIDIVIFIIPQLLIPDGIIAENETTNNLIETAGQKKEFLFAVLLAPIYETFLVQALIVGGGCSFFEYANQNIRQYGFRNYTWPLIFISAIVFGLSHTYNIWYILVTFLAGIVLAFAYHVARRRKLGAYIIVTLVHAFHNLTAEIIDRLLGYI